jgi:hypothetical protein
MALSKGIDVDLLESLVKRHFGREFTCRLAWNVLRGRYEASEEPRRLALPQVLFGIRIWWQTVGEFSYNLGFRLEVWSAEHLPPAQALAADYNAKVDAPKLDVRLSAMSWSASSRSRAA